MKYFIDTEFIEDGIILDLVSLAIVSEDGRELYVCNSGARLMRADAWIKNHVLQHLPGITINRERGVVCNDMYCNPLYNWRTMHEIVLEIIRFIGNDEKPEFWADYGAYDWVAFARCFGRLIDLPKNFPVYFKDFQMLLDLCGGQQFRNGFDLRFEKDQAAAHIALDDARNLKKQFDYINGRFQFGVADNETGIGHEVKL